VVVAGHSGEFDAGDVLTDAPMDSPAEADVSGWVAGEPKECGPAVGSWLAAQRNIGVLNCAARALLVATSSRGEIIGVDPVELLAELGDLGLVGVGDGGVECEGRRPDEVEQFVGGADRSARL
jgi:hypothetical protein